MTDLKEKKDKPQRVNNFLRGLLMPAAAAYGAGALTRLLAYSYAVVPRYKATVPVISVGNLTVGGTGKTPVVIDLARRFVQAGFRPAILSRGYKRKSTAPFVVVSDGTTILTSCQDAGDEPFLIAQSVPRAVVIVGAKRATTAEIAINQLGCDLIILDDGFQHLKVRRDLDIVLIDYNDDIENDLLLPAGRLREPLASLARASSVVITKIPPTPDRAKLERISEIIHKYNSRAAIGLLRFNADALVSFDQDTPDGSKLTTHPGLESIPTGLIAFCGLARPQRFFNELHGNMINPLNEITFADHHWYTAADITKFNELAQKHKASAFITTEKDIVKLAQFRKELTLPVLAIGLTTQWISSLPPMIDELIAKGPH